ncbi:uncharacterized protein JCM10292_004857 [Rhodotorula paludigena]|uniref:uncharacterized protein n=1 Tax=Rhodotorula paludigena TaxID=86838 RepID=UPI00317DA231
MPPGDPNFPSGLSIKPSTRQVLRLDAGADGDEHEAAQDVQRFGIAGRTWEAAYFLRLYLTPPRSPSPPDPPKRVFDPPCPLFPPSSLQTAPSPTTPSLEHKRQRTILEIGAGTGYLSLSLAPHLSRARDRVIATDLPSVCPLLEENLAAAQERWGASSPAKGTAAAPGDGPASVLVRPLPWGDAGALADLQAEGLSPDLVLASDLVYFEFLYAPLLRTLLGLTEPRGEEGESAVVLFSYKVRSLTKEQPFWEAFGRWFAFDAVHVGTLARPDPPASAHPPTPSQHHLTTPTTTPPPPLAWTRFGAGIPSSSSASPTSSETDELYLFVCRRHPETYGASVRLAEEQTSDDELLQGRKAGRGVEHGAGRFEEIILAGLEWE